MTREEQTISNLKKLKSFHNGSYGTDIDRAIKALEQEPCEDAISRQAVTDTTICEGISCNECSFNTCEDGQSGCLLKERVDKLPPVNPQPKTDWIPVSDRLPEDLEPVNITWVNHEPEPYYHDIKDKNFIATGIHYRDQWYWYSTTCADYLGEYGSNEIDLVDDAIEIVAWMPLPAPFEPQESETWNGIHALITAPKGTFERIFNEADDDSDI